VRGVRRSSPTPSPSPTVGPAPEERNFVANGGFDDGLDGWYVEDDVGVAVAGGRSRGPAVRLGAGGGYVDGAIAIEPGRSYRLQAWGRVSVAGDSGRVGILYLDAEGNRIESEEPRPIVYDELTLTRHSIKFTAPPAAAAARVYVWKPSGPAEFVVDDVSVREIVTIG
jgi:hypothetical protein